jgi:hypothetical protein
MLAITATGANRAPKADTRRQTLSLKGSSAGRIVQALLEREPPVGVRELAEQANVSPGSVSKTLPLLTAEEAISRSGDGQVITVNRRQVLNRWTLDYRVLASNPEVRYFVAPRGIDQAQEALAGQIGTGFTGSQGARAYLPTDVAAVVPSTQIVCYATSPSKAAADAGLVEVDAPSANVILVASQDKTLPDRTAVIGETPIVPLPLVLADLLTLPGRYPQQAEALMDALAKTDPAWRQ